MRILILGGGGREHAIGWRLKKDHPEGEFFFAPGNGGTEKIGINLPINPEDPKEVASVCAELKIDFVVVGPENPLAHGVCDILEEEGRICFGPKKKAAQIEASKAFAKRLMADAGIPTPNFKIYTLNDFKQGKVSPEKLTPPVVIKASGLCAGKGSFVCMEKEEVQQAIERIFVRREFGDEGNEIVVEEFLEGKEISYFALCSKNEFRTIGFARDYKRLSDNDKGPNTGGMGSYTPVEYGDDKLKEKVEKAIVSPLMEVLSKIGIEYTGILYVGIMISSGEPYVLEFNVRLGDPEAQVLMPCIKGDFLNTILSASVGKLEGEIEMSGSALCVVLASAGYPGKYKKGVEIEIRGDEEKENEFVVFHAGTERLSDGKLITSGGRVLNVVGIGKNLEEARSRAYRKIEDIKFDGMNFRKDIGK